MSHMVAVPRPYCPDAWLPGSVTETKGSAAARAEAGAAEREHFSWPHGYHYYGEFDDFFGYGWPVQISSDAGDKPDSAPENRSKKMKGGDDESALDNAWLNWLLGGLSHLADDREHAVTPLAAAARTRSRAATGTLRLSLCAVGTPRAGRGCPATPTADKYHSPLCSGPDRTIYPRCAEPDHPPPPLGDDSSPSALSSRESSSASAASGLLLELEQTVVVTATKIEGGVGRYQITWIDKHDVVHTVWRRYNDFAALHASLSADAVLGPTVAALSFPPKRPLSYFSRTQRQRLLKERRNELESYLGRLLLEGIVRTSAGERTQAEDTPAKRLAAFLSEAPASEAPESSAGPQAMPTAEEGIPPGDATTTVNELVQEDGHSGTLRKLKVGKGWKQRYCRIESGDTTLKWAKGQPSEGGLVLQNALDLSGARLLEDVPTDWLTGRAWESEPKDPSLCFAIEKGGEKFVFASSSQEDMIRWLKVIRAKVGQSE